MNLQKIYNGATGKEQLAKTRLAEAEAEVTEDGSFVVDKESQAEPTDDASRKKIKIDWLNSTATQEMIKALVEQRDTLTGLAIQKSLTYPQHNNHAEIIATLVKAGTIQSIIDTYGKSN